MATDATMTTGYWIAWCTRCRRYYETIGGTREGAVACARRHTKKTGHGLWLERLPQFGPPGRVVGRRGFDPSRRDDRIEEVMRGGV